MHTLQILNRSNVIKLTVQTCPDGRELRSILDDIEQSRAAFSAGYKLWIMLPPALRDFDHEELAKLDLAVYVGKKRGLRQTVIEAPEDCPSADQFGEFLLNLYRDVSVPVSLTHDDVEARKSLGILWQ